MGRYASNLMTAQDAARVLGVHGSTLTLAARTSAVRYQEGGWEWPQRIGGRWVAPELVWREIGRRTAPPEKGGRPRKGAQDV